METQLVLWFLVVVAHVIAASASSFPTTVPAFVWSNNPSRHLDHGEQGSVNYNIISSEDLAKNVLNTAGWSQVLCSGKKRDITEVALVFIGNELHSSHISRKRDTDTELIELLKASFSESNFSMAFPYVALSEDRGTLANSLLSGFMENCDHGLRTSEIAVVAPCSLEGHNIKNLPHLNAITDYVNARKESNTGEDTNLIFVCSDKSSESEASVVTQMESKILAQILVDLKQSGITYSVLYTSDPYEMVPHLRFEKLERHLLSNAAGKASENVTFCDAECKSKASILEGLLVGLILLIILLFGLKCMSGIETPTRFEAPHES